MKWAIIGFYFLSVLHIHFRGRVRLPFGRQLFDHSSFMAPINIFMHFFSRVPSTPYLPVSEFKELAPLHFSSVQGRLQARVEQDSYEVSGRALAMAVAGFTPAEADGLRRALSHKRAEERLGPFHQRFVEGGVARGYTPEYVDTLFR